MNAPCRWLLSALLTAVLASCGPKDGDVDNLSEPETLHAKSWSGTSFDDEYKEIDAAFEIVTDGWEECADLLKLEPLAMMGRLSGEQIVCLDHRLRYAERQTQKDRLSRVIMADAWGKGDLHRWEGAVRRHLEQIDRSDPDLCYLFAVHLSKNGYRSAFEAMRWAEISLENKQLWEGELYKARVKSLLKIRAIAAQQMWHHHAAQFLETQDPRAMEQRDRWRAVSKTLAREWLEYLKRIGDDYQFAYDICVSASGTQYFCETE